MPDDAPSKADDDKSMFRNFLREIFVDDYAQKTAIGRAAMAAGYGLDPGAYSRPFPGSSQKIEVNQSGLGKQAAAALVLASTVGGVGGGALLNSLFTAAASAVPTQSTAAPALPAAPPPVTFTPSPQRPPTSNPPRATLTPLRGKIRFWTEDGTVIE